MIILSATWANADHTAAVVVTEEAGAVAISEIDRPQLWQEFEAWVALGNTPAPVPPPSAADLRTDALLADPARADLIDKLRNASPSQIDSYIDNNVTTLAGARALFKIVLKVLALNVQQ